MNGMNDSHCVDDNKTPKVDTDMDEDIEEHTSEELMQLKVKAIELKNEGNDNFKKEIFDKSIGLYTEALDMCPLVFVTDRSVMYSNRSAALLHCDRRQEALDDCTAAIDLNNNYIKPLLRRAQIYRQMSDKLDDSLKDYQRVFELNPKCTEAMVAINELQKEINERNEKLKTEMMSKLKDLGNLVLRPFGMSTDNFKLTQNAETGGYSVNFQNN
ncbi:tetratricopeptide repeat protein 1-like [Oppia nitens]|uniref:tetratricopeptide repeat protein 1-like n=1 Tax=Oppia nitens TaxID=1686743 RepID=UPI0023DCD1A3|nr:tetratricopeptide repeat protein 1-like [Oppia nitens]